jgi:hypothetical protein
VAGTSVALVLHPRRDYGLIAPPDERVDETVAAAFGDVVVAEKP